MGVVHAKAKLAWERFPQTAGSIFRFDQYPQISAFARRNLEGVGHVITLGGGRGDISNHASAPGRTWKNLELRTIQRPLVPTVKGDMETFKDPQSLREPEVLCAAITPFSLEYTRINLSIQTLADILQSKERWVWLCHHPDSGIVVDFRRIQEMNRYARQLLVEVVHASPQELQKLAVRYQTEVWRVFPEANGIEVARASPERFEQLQGLFGMATGDRLARSLCIVAALRSAASNPLMVRSLVEQVTLYVYRNEADLACAGPLLERTWRTPAALAAHVHGYFRFMDGIEFNQDNAPIALGAVFERL